MFSDTFNDFNKSRRKRIVFCDCLDCEPVEGNKTDTSTENLNTSSKEATSTFDPLAAARQVIFNFQ